MAALPFEKIMPKEKMSETAVPKAVRDAVLHIFANCKEGAWLVGGTALAGYYAEHRRSDDIDLFTSGELSHRMAILAVRSLQKVGAVFSNEMQTPQFFRADVKWRGHKFTVDIVLDENIHKIGHAIRSKDGVLVADLKTLFAMKAACMVSRASEKDLFDMDWIFTHAKEPSAAALVSLGSQIDGGLTAETVLISLKGALLRKDACNFILPGKGATPADAFHRVIAMQKKLIHLLLEYERSSPPSHDTSMIAKAVKFAKRLKK